MLLGLQRIYLFTKRAAGHVIKVVLYILLSLQKV